MADQQGPSLNIPFDSRNLEQLKRYQDAAKRARQEIKALKKEMEEATAQGRSIDRKAIDRLRTLEAIDKKATEVVKAEKEGAAARRESLRLAREERSEIARQTSLLTRAGKVTRKLAMSPVAHRILAGGNLDVSDARMLADPFLMEGASRGIRRAGVAMGNRAIGAVGRGLGAVANSPAAMLALHVTIDRVQKIASELSSIRRARDSVTAQAGSGQISGAEARLFDKSMDRFQLTGDKGQTSLDMLRDVQQVGEAVHGGKIKPKDLAGLAGGPEFVRIMQAFIDKRVRDKSLNLGRALAGDEEKRAIRAATAEFLKNVDPDIIERITKSMLDAAEKNVASEHVRELTGAQKLNERFQGDLENFNNFQRAQKELEKLGAAKFIPGTTQVQGHHGTPAKSSPVVASASQAAEDEKAGVLNAREQHLIQMLTRDGHDD